MKKMIVGMLLAFAATASAQDKPTLYIEAPPAPAFVDEDSKAMEKRVADVRKALEHRRSLVRVVDAKEDAQLVLRFVSYDKEMIANTGKGFWGDMGQDVANSIHHTRTGQQAKTERPMVEQRVLRTELIVGDYKVDLVRGDSTQPQPTITQQVERWIKANREALR